VLCIYNTTCSSAYLSVVICCYRTARSRGTVKAVFWQSAKWRRRQRSRWTSQWGLNSSDVIFAFLLRSIVCKNVGLWCLYMVIALLIVIKVLAAAWNFVYTMHSLNNTLGSVIFAHQLVCPAHYNRQICWQAFPMASRQLCQLAVATRATSANTSDCFKWALKMLVSVSGHLVADDSTCEELHWRGL